MILIESKQMKGLNVEDRKWPSVVESKLKDQNFSDWINFVDENKLNIPRFSLESSANLGNVLIHSTNIFCSGLKSDFSQDEKSLLKKFNIEKTYKWNELQAKASINLALDNVVGLSSIDKLGYFTQKLINLFDQSFEHDKEPEKVDCLISVNSTFFEMISYVSCFRILFQRISSFYEFKNTPKLVLWSIPDPRMQNKVFIEGNYLKNLYSGLAAKLAGVDYVIAKNYHYQSEEKVFSTDLLAYMNLCLLDEEGAIGNFDKNIIQGTTLIENYQESMVKKVWDEFVSVGRDQFLRDDEWKPRIHSTEKEKTIVGVNAFESKLFQTANFSLLGDSNE